MISILYRRRDSSGNLKKDCRSCLYKLPEKMYTLFGENVNLQNVVKTEGGGYHGLQENSTADL